MYFVQVGCSLITLSNWDDKLRIAMCTIKKKSAKSFLLKLYTTTVHGSSGKSSGIRLNL